MVLSIQSLQKILDLFKNIILRLLDVDDKFLEFWVFFAFFARTCREYLTTVSWHIVVLWLLLVDD